MKRQLIFIFSLLLTFVLYAQDYTVQGIVTSADDGLPLPGVNVMVKGGTLGTITDFDGVYSLNVPTGSTLVFSYIGCKTEERVINQPGTVNILLTSDATMLDEVVAIGYGTMKKSDLTGSVSTISADQLKKTPAANLDQALQGRAAGVTVNANTGQPGAAAEVRIRGIGTVNDASPLYVVDNVIVSDISFLNPNDIASTEILKDASATAIYGSRGANGVILVTTKKGSADGRTEISFNTYVGFQNRWKKLDLMKSDELIRTLIGFTSGRDGEKQLESYETGGINQWLSEWMIGRAEQYPVIKSEANPDGMDYSKIETDWQDEVFNKNALIQNYHLSIDGSTEKANYSLSASYFNQDGTIIGSSYDRITLRVNTSFQVRNWLKVGENLSFVTSEGRNAMNNNSSPGASVLSAALAMAPWDPVYYPQGTYNYQGKDMSGELATGTNFKNVTNPVSMVVHSFPKDKTQRWVGDIYAEITPVKGLTFRSDISYDYSVVNHRLFKPAYYVSPYDNMEQNFLERGLTTYATVIWENILTYNKSIKLHDFLIMGGHTMEEYNKYGISGSGSDIYNPTSTNWYLSQTTDKRSEAGDLVERTRRLSFLGRLHYSYMNRYLLTFNFRADGSNKFPQNTWGYFPSLALGWKINEEQWMREIHNLDYLKLRAGWGRIGNDKIGNDNFTPSIFNTGPYFVDYVLGAEQQVVRGATILTYKNLGGKWEVTETWNGGVDFGWFNGQLSGSVELFRRNTKDMLLTVKGPAYVGNRWDATKNVGTVRNQGIEITLDHQNRVNKVNYSINGNISFIENKLTKLNGGDTQFIDGIRINDEGYALYTFWGYKYEGVYKTDEEAAAHLWGSEPLRYGAGDAKYADLNGDGIIDDNDKTDIGNPFPWLNYGLNLAVEWKGLDVQLFFQGVHGNKIYNEVLNRTEGKGVEATLSTSMRNVWRVDNPNGTIPSPHNSLNFAVSSRFVESGSYLRLKNAQIGYNLPASVISKIGVNRCRLYVSVSNLFTITKYSGYDPEVGDGVDYGNYPQSRTVMLGANLNF